MIRRLLIFWDINLKISISVKFIIPMIGNNVRYAIQKITPPTIKFKMLPNCEYARKMDKGRAEMVEAKYILAEEEASRLTLIFLTAVSNRYSSEQKLDMKRDVIRPIIPYNWVNNGADGIKTSMLTKLAFRTTSVLPIPLNRY